MRTVVPLFLALVFISRLTNAQTDGGGRTYTATFVGFRGAAGLAAARARAFVTSHSAEIGTCYGNAIEVPAAAAGDTVTMQFSVGARGQLTGFYVSGGVRFGDCVSGAARAWSLPGVSPISEITLRIAVRPSP